MPLEYKIQYFYQCLNFIVETQQFHLPWVKNIVLQSSHSRNFSLKLLKKFLKYYYLNDQLNPDHFNHIKDLPNIISCTNLQAGIGLPQEHTKLLCHSTILNAKDRILIKFPPSNPTVFKLGDPIELQVTLKNIPSLLLKVIHFIHL